MDPLFFTTDYGLAFAECAEDALRHLGYSVLYSESIMIDLKEEHSNTGYDKLSFGGPL